MKRPLDTDLTGLEPAQSPDRVEARLAWFIGADGSERVLWNERDGEITVTGAPEAGFGELAKIYREVASCMFKFVQLRALMGPDFLAALLDPEGPAAVATQN